MRILYVAMKHDYGKAAQGFSFEHYNFYHSLLHMGHDVLYFDFMTLLAAHGRPWLNRRLVEIARSEKPDLLFSVLFNEEFDKKTFRSISAGGSTFTLNWFCDDHWRFDTFSRKWAASFNGCITTSSEAFEKYRRLGHTHVVKSQWGCNHLLYRPLDLPFRYDVSFVGQPYGIRRAVIEYLREKGIEVAVWGTGWKTGRASQERMIEIFNESRINLNLSNGWGSNRASRARYAAGRLLDRLPFGSALKAAGRSMGAGGETKITSQFPAGEQIKGRNFEVPGSGGFLLTGRADNLGDYFREGEEVGCFSDLDTLTERIRHYLLAEDERVRIAGEGYRRTLGEHTYVHRFCDVFKAFGLPHRPAGELLENRVSPGTTEEAH